LETMLKELR